MNDLTPSRMLSQDSDRPFWLAIREREKRRSALVGAINAIDAFERCPECRAGADARVARANARLDAIRDRGLTFRDANESLSLMILDLVEAM